MTEEDQKRIVELQALIEGDPDYFTESENTAIRLQREGATVKQMALIMRCSTTTVRKYLQRRQRRIERAQQLLTAIKEGEANEKENQDLRTAYTDRGNAGAILKLLLPHINEIKELCK
jgi:DNA-binding CsgD family transcriptional regulator